MLLFSATELFVLHLCDDSSLIPVRQVTYLHTLEEKVENYLNQVEFEQDQLKASCWRCDNPFVRSNVNINQHSYFSQCAYRIIRKWHQDRVSELFFI